MKRQRGRGRKPGGGGGGGGNHNHNHGNRSLESSGPDVKIRGTATQIYEKYAQYARDAQSGGDRVRYENFLQHAEHYYRVMAASMPRDRLLAQQAQGEGGQQMPQQNPDGTMQQPNDGNGQGGEQPDSMKVMDSEGADDGDDGFDDDGDDQGEEAEANASGGGQDDRTDNQQDSQQDQGERQGRGRRRRGRKRHDGPQGGGDRPQNANGNGGGNGGGDTEARSALDSLARKQGALAGS